MFQTAMIINTFRLLENSLEIIVIEKFYEFLSRTLHTRLHCFIPKRQRERSSIAPHFSRIGYRASRGRKTRVKENLFSSRGEIKIALTSATRHARKSILHARCAPGIIGNWNFIGRRLAWHLTAISPHRYVCLRTLGREGGGEGKGSLLFRMDVSRGAQACNRTVIASATPTFLRNTRHRTCFTRRSDVRRSRRHYFLDHFLNSSQLFAPLFAPSFAF